MKKATFILLFLSLSSYQTTEKEVYICKSTSSKRYHLKKNCRGLTRCKKEIKKITKSTAERYGRTLCKWED